MLRSGGVVTTLAILGGLVTAGSAVGGSPTTRWVDADGQAGPSDCHGTAAASTTIQSAVTASGPADTVLVCPGSYAEQVRIRGPRTGLTLRSVTPFGATILAPASLVAPRGYPFLVAVERVDDVTIRGFRLRARAGGTCEMIQAMVGALASQRTMVRGNRIGSVGGDGGCRYFVAIAFTDALDPSAATPVGIRPSSLTAAYNLVTGFEFAGIGAFPYDYPATFRAIGNSVRYVAGTGGQAGIVAIGPAAALIERNVVRGFDPGGAGRLPVGVAALPNAEAGVRSVTIRRNLLDGSTVGVQLERADEAIVRENLLRGTDGAVTLSDVDGAVVRDNDALHGDQGLWVGNGSADNTIRGNTLSGGCIDETTGSGTAGTANTWFGNTANASSPTGICAVP